jgi:hypothetical protein
LKAIAIPTATQPSVCSKVADQRADRVRRPEREGGTDTGRLLPATVIERARHPALLVEADAALLDRAVQGHETEERNAVVVVEIRRLGPVLGERREWPTAGAPPIGGRRLGRFGGPWCLIGRDAHARIVRRLPR